MLSSGKKKFKLLFSIMKNIFTGITLGGAPRGDECKFKLINYYELFYRSCLKQCCNDKTTHKEL